MAKLTNQQEKYYYERQKKREERLKIQLQAQKKKELEGDGWEKAKKDNPNLTRDQVLQQISGIIELPKVYDSIEISEFFPPINFFTKEDGTILEIDYKEYENSQAKYNAFIKKSLAEDKKLYKEYIDKDFIPEVPERQEPKKNTNISQNFYMNIGKYFTRFAPIYDKYICNCCGMPKKISEFYEHYNYINANKIDYSGQLHLSVCKSCCSKLFDYLYKEVANCDPEFTMYYFCCIMGIYWDVDVFYKTKELMEHNKNNGHIIQEYLILNNSVNIGKTFLNNLKESKLNASKENLKEKEKEEKKEESFESNSIWNQESLRDKKIVEKMVGYDPFYFEDEEKRPSLYKDLIGMLEQGMEQDQIKLQAAIQIVISYSRVRRMNEEINKLEKENGKISEIKALSDLKNKELKNITDFSRDNGFSERFATAKAKGENTFTGIMNKMNEAKFEDGLLNAYDIATSESINQAAQASFKAIFEQISLGETEVWKVAQEQLAELLKLRKENEILQEDLRKARYEIAKKNLIEKAQKRGIEVDEE